ncbi:MAG TPA: hydrogenase nickel incorporation protein HypA [Opitutaceae bacterium]|nr:hydrogenase nickel incorporation protein HypA [Opitutaceae bacterium]
MLDLTAVAAVYCVLVAAVFLTLWLWYDRRDHRRFELERRKTTFHCIRCDALYTAPSGAELCKCPKCGHENVRLKF